MSLCAEILDEHTDEGFKVLVLDGAARGLLQPHLLARHLVNDSIATLEFVDVAVNITLMAHSKQDTKAVMEYESLCSGSLSESPVALLLVDRVEPGTRCFSKANELVSSPREPALNVELLPPYPPSSTTHFLFIISASE